MKTHQLEVHGAYKWIGKEADTLFKCSEIDKQGIYIWTLPINNQYLTYYVGETGTSFGDRFLSHTRGYLDGLYRVYDPEEFAKGNKKLVWEGMWKKELGPTAQRMHLFLNSYEELSKAIYEMMSTFRIFLFPLKCDRRTRQRIEASLAKAFYSQTGLTGSFQDSDIRYAETKSGEEPIEITFTSNFDIIGLPKKLRC